MLVLRVRTNLGSQRLSVESDSISLSSLREAICARLCIDGDPSNLMLSRDLAGAERLSNDAATLRDLALRSGDEVVVLGRFACRVVDKAFVNDKHELVAAGTTTLVLVAPPDGLQAKDHQDPQKYNEKADHPSRSVEKETNSPIPKEIADESAFEDEKLIEKEGEKQIEEDLPSFEEFEELPDDEVRSADDVQSMRLMTDVQTVELDDEEQAQLQAYRVALRAQGLREYDVEQYAMERVDEILARRLSRYEENEQRITNDGYRFSTLEELERLVNANRQRNTLMLRDHQQRRVPAQRDTERNASAVAQTHTHLSHKYRVAPRERDPQRERELQRARDALGAAAQRSLQRTPALPTAPRESERERPAPHNTHNTQSVHTTRPPAVSLSPAPRQSLTTTNYRAFSQFKTKSTTATAATHTERRTATAADRETELDVRLAVEMSLTEQRRAAQPARERERRRQGEDAQREELRAHLHRDQALSLFARRAVDSNTEEALLLRAKEESLLESATTSSEGPWYDEEDEMLARALQESLNTY